nr:MAG TPA: hypothetical protein [Caudoviricetes sp.]
MFGLPAACPVLLPIPPFLYRFRSPASIFPSSLFHLSFPAVGPVRPSGVIFQRR